MNLLELPMDGQDQGLSQLRFTLLTMTSSKRDALNESLSIESCFDLAYNAAHAFCLPALRWHGYRSSNRYVVFQLLPHTLDLREPSPCHEDLVAVKSPRGLDRLLAWCLFLR